METFVEILSTALLLSFVICCAASGFLQIRAWGKHARPDVPVSLRALRQPEQFFDPIGFRQMILAKRLLTIGGVAYVTYGLLIVVNSLR